MTNKFASLTLLFALICTLGGPSTFGSTLSDPKPEPKSANTTSDSSPAIRTEAQPNEKLSTDMRKLVADAKAGRVMPTAKSQIQPAKSNNWSKRTKIAVGVGIAVAVVVVILVVKHQKEHFFDGFALR